MYIWVVRTSFLFLYLLSFYFLVDDEFGFLSNIWFLLLDYVNFFYIELVLVLIFGIDAVICSHLAPVQMVGSPSRTRKFSEWKICAENKFFSGQIFVWPWCFLTKFRVTGGGPDKLNTCEVTADSRMPTWRLLRIHISWYNTMGVLPSCGCAWITFWKNSHWSVFMATMETEVKTFQR